MKIHVNLATRPFVELRPFFLRLRILMAVLAVVSLGLAIGIHAMSKRLQHAELQIDEVHAATVAAQQEKNRNEARMHQPQNAAVLERAHFLNELFLRKSFSWTAVMMDLETVLPVGVQVTAIEPQVTAEGDVVIRLRVSGDRDRAVQLVRNLERSKRFLHPRLSGEATQAKQTGQNNQPVNPSIPAGVEFDILANYNPLPPNETYKFAKPPSEPLPATAAVVAPAVPMRAVPSPRPVPSPVPGSNPSYPRDGVVLKPYNQQPQQPQQLQPGQPPMRRPFGPARIPPGGER